jgi:hypothetical protein
MAVTNPFTGGSAALSDIPVELQPQLQQANRQQQMANLLLQQGMSGQPQGQMVSGHYVAPSWSQNLAPIANAALGLYAGYQADKAQTDLATALRGKQEEIMTKWATATPAERFQLGTSPYAPKALQAATWERLKPQNLPEGATIAEYDISKGTYTPTAQGGPKTSNDIKYAIAVGGLPADYSTWTPAQQNYAQKLIKDKEASSAPKYDFTNLLGKSTLGTVGPMLELSKAGAVDAIDTANAATRVLGALDTGKALTGPAANQRLAVNQVGTMLGISGTNEEVAAQTRTLIQNLAKLTLQGRKQMRGQGAVSETEGALAEKAESGNINFTRAEIKQLADAALRTSKWKYQQHENMMTPLREDEPRSARYYEVPVNPSIFEPPKPKTVGTSQTVNDALAIVRGQTSVPPAGGTR